MSVLLSSIIPRDPEPAVLSYQQAVHRHQFALQPQLLDVALAEMLAGVPFLLEQAAGQSIASCIAVTVSRVRLRRRKTNSSPSPGLRSRLSAVDAEVKLPFQRIRQFISG